MKLSRRQGLMAGVALGAAGLGAWWADRRFTPAAPLDGIEAAFWDGVYSGPDGQTVRLADFRGQPLLVNFWATWCPPCVEELPLLNAFQREHGPRGWRLVGLAVDQVEPVRRFLRQLPLAFPVGMAGLAGTELSRGLGNTSGGLPFTVVFGPDGRVQHRKIGQVTPDDLAAWAAGA